MILEKSFINDAYFSNDFGKNLNQFLEKSEREYPINIVSSNENGVNILLLKNIKNIDYNFEYENAVNAILNYLIKIIPKYGLHEIDYTNEDYGFHPTFNIHVPMSVSSKQLDTYWDDIVGEVVDFVESEKIEFILNDISIILCR